MSNSRDAITFIQWNTNAVIKNNGYKSSENKLTIECKWRNSGHKIFNMPPTPRKMIYQYIGKNWKSHWNISTSQVVGVTIFSPTSVIFLNFPLLHFTNCRYFKGINPKNLSFKTIFKWIRTIWFPMWHSQIQRFWDKCTLIL